MVALPFGTGLPRDRYSGMTVPVSHIGSGSDAHARRASKAYHMAERLGRPPRYSSEWRQLCRADKTRQSLYVFQDIFEEDEAENDAIERGVVRPQDDKVRSAYFICAVAVGTLCLLCGAFLVI